LKKEHDMNRATPSVIRVLLLGLLFLHAGAALHADGGAVRLSERRGGYQITVFTVPTPVRAGPVDISVFVQDGATGELVPQARITVRAVSRAHPGQAICAPATAAAATNKLFQAASVELPEPGEWDVEMVIEGLCEPIRVHFEMEAAEASPHGGELGPWIAWPVLAVALFVIHQWLVRRAHAPAAKKGGC
jgi:hypothetical protein